MKKNRSMRLASGLLILTLLTTCIISGTFAKYTTTGTGSDSARVAKWGVTVTATSDSLFKNSYATNGTVNDYQSQVITNSVVANDTDKLVAPGTSGSMTAVKLLGTPEVAVNVNYAATLTITGWEVDGSEYFPIVITVNETDYKMATSMNEDNHEYDSITDLKAAVVAAINAYTANYAPNTTLSDVATPSVSWRWDFAGGEGAYQTDTKDTALGDLTTAPTIALEVTTTVTQVD